MTREDKAEFHKRLDEAREDSGSGPLQLPRDHIMFNVSFTVLYANNSIEGGYVP